jgi:transposase
MTTLSFIRKMFRLKGLKVINFDFKARMSVLNLIVKPHKNGCRCPICGRRGQIVNQLGEFRSWEDIVIAGWKIILWYAPREIKCPKHGRQQEEIPWAAPNAQCSYRYEFVMLTYSKVMTQKAASYLLKTPSSTLSNRLHRAIERIRKGHRIRNLKTIGIDEISYCKGRKYATIVYDLDKGVVLWVGKGKGRETIDRFFNDELSDYQKQQIKWASCDMSETYIGAIKDHCPNAKLVLDHFHIVKALNDAVDEVRKEAWREACGDNRKAMKGLRWLLYRHSSTRTKSGTRTLNNLRKGNKRIYRAWVLKDELEHFWSYISRGWAEKFLNSWITSALRSRLEPLKRFARTLRRHQDNIVNFIERNLSNAKGEGLNRVIKIVKNRASGFRNLDSFTDMIFLTVGDLDIPAQIPLRFRTL